MTTAVGGFGGSDWSIVDPTTVAPGSGTLVGGMSTGSSDFTTPALFNGTPLGTASYPQTSASTIVAPYGSPAASLPPTPNYAGYNSATLGLASLGGGAAPANGASAQDRILYAHVAAPDAAAPAPPEPPKELEVKPGDTLSKLAGQHGTTWQKLYELNKDVIGDNPDLIKPGQKLRLP